MFAGGRRRSSKGVKGWDKVFDLEKTAISRIKTASDMSLKLYQQPLVVCYSGGKDSDVLLRLFDKSGVPFEILHSLTTADAPETVRHVRSVLHKYEGNGVPCDIDYHKKPDGTRTTMWNLIPRKLMPPTRIVRYCCAELKETGAQGRFIATGVRWDESRTRKNGRGSLEVQNSDRKRSLILQSDNDESRRLFENCSMKGKRVVNPIIDWTTDDVLDYAESEKIELNPLYKCGFSRVGCIGCPMAGRKGREFEFEEYPKYKAAYIKAFDRMLDERHRRGLPCEWQDRTDVFRWWMEYDVLPGQEILEGFE